MDWVDPEKLEPYGSGHGWSEGLLRDLRERVEATVRRHMLELAGKTEPPPPGTGSGRASAELGRAAGIDRR